MLAASRPMVLAAAALAATGAVIATPVLAHQVPLTVRSLETKLVDAGDIGNIPVNLFNDILSIPAYELQSGGLASVANSFLFTGTWWVPSSTNIWGIDPGDPTHIALIDNFIPFKDFTQGFTDADGLYHPGLNYEFAGLLAAELPNSSSCDAMSCAPMTPPDVITGNTGYDRDIGFFESLMGKGIDADGNPNGLFTNFFQVPLQNLMNGYTFQAPPADMPTSGEPTGDPGVINPAGPVNDDWANYLGWGSSGNPFENGTSVVDVPGYGDSDVNPWYGLDYHLNLLQPFQTLYDGLTQDPSTTGIAGTGIEALSFTDVTHTFENLEAGLIIDFDPFTAGSPACPATCDYLPAGSQIPDIIRNMSAMDPSNQTLAEWVLRYDQDPTLVNDPTQQEINASVALLQTGSYNYSPEQLAEVDAALGRINPELPELYTNGGIITDPNYLTYINDPTDPDIYNSSGQLVGEYGGYNPLFVGADLLKLGEAAGSNPVDPTLSADLQFLFTQFTFPGDPAALSTLLGESAAATPAATVDPSALDPGFATDLSSLLASFGGTAGADTLSAALADLSAQFTADLAQIVPQSILGAL